MDDGSCGVKVSSLGVVVVNVVRLWDSLLQQLVDRVSWSVESRDFTSLDECWPFTLSLELSEFQIINYGGPQRIFRVFY